MGYKRADDVLPESILKSLQRYVSGETIYVPKGNADRKKWGSNTDANEKLRQRNEQILEQHRKGVGVKELAKEYYLTEKSIQRILKAMRVKPPMESKYNCRGGNKIE
ncbi:MAG: CD3324 family protein [Butyrivibrio sp.]|nr:CD3324 family protein [Acetatifactor muris]MCM1558781.1 CD3324 family protein [Butyrivibrio sp.]